MTMPFYVSPEQQMKDRADYARKGIARGRSAIVLQYEHGIVFVAENLSGSLHKVSEIYDRIAFAAVGRYNEFENLRMAGIRVADMQGYAFDRRDVTGRGLANTYAQVLGTLFSSGAEKPYEVELFVAQVGDTTEDDEIYRLTYDGSVADEHRFAVMGGSADQVSAYVTPRYTQGCSLAEALQVAVAGLGHDSDPPRQLTANQLEVAVLDRTRSQVRKFKRLRGSVLERLLDGGSVERSAAPGTGSVDPDTVETEASDAEEAGSEETGTGDGAGAQPGSGTEDDPNSS